MTVRTGGGPRWEAGLISWLLIATGAMVIWVLWQGGTLLLGLGPGDRVVLAIAAILLLVAGFYLLLYWFYRTDSVMRRRLLWAAAAIALVAGATLWYTSSALTVFPNSAKIRVGTSVTLTAGPLTAVERLLGRQYVQWRTSDSVKAPIDSVTEDPLTGRQVAVVRGDTAGRAIIFAVRGKARYATHIEIEDTSGNVPPEPCQPFAPFPEAPRPTAANQPKRAPAREPEQEQEQEPEPPRCISGTISSPSGHALGRVRVSLRAIRQKDTLWVQHDLTDPVTGRYEFRVPWDSAMRAEVLHLAVHPRITESSPVWFIPTEWGLDTTTRVIDRDLIDVVANRDLDVRLEYSSQSAFAILFLLLPAVIGLLTIVQYFSAYRPGPTPNTIVPRMGAGALDNEYVLIRRYVIPNALVWGGLLGLLGILYAFRNVQAISLFGGEITVPITAPAFAFLGVLVYAISVLAEEYLQGLGRGRTAGTDRNRILLSLGNRIVIAPYVAIVAVVLFEDLDSRLVPFVAFFTGLWIEPVLGALREVGERLVKRPLVGDRRAPGEGNPVPVVSEIRPSEVPAGTTGQKLLLTGSGFLKTSSVSIGDKVYAEGVYRDATTLEVAVDDAQLATPGELPVCVVNPAPGGGTSEPCRLLTVRVPGPAIPEAEREIILEKLRRQAPEKPAGPEAAMQSALDKMSHRRPRRPPGDIPRP